MRMPAVVVGHHGDGDIADLRFARQLGFLKIGHADHVHAPAAVDVGFGLGGKLRTFHAQVSSAALANDSSFLAGAFHHASQVRTNWIREGDMGHDAVPKKSIDAVARAVEKLVGDDELQRLMLFLQ